MKDYVPQTSPVYHVNSPKGYCSLTGKPIYSPNEATKPRYAPTLAWTKDGAGGGLAAEQTCAWGRSMQLLKIGESRTQMRGWDDNFRMVLLSEI